MARLVTGFTRRRFIFGGAITLATTALAACSSAPATSPPTAAPASASGAPTPTQATQSSSAAPTAASASSQGPVTLSVTNVEAYSAELDKKVFPVGYDIFSKQNNGQIKVSETILPEDPQYYVKILTMVAGGTPPDLSYVHPAAGLPQFASTKTILPIDDYVKADSTVNIADVYPGPLSYYSYPHGAKLYGIPWYSGPAITIFNKGLFQKAGEKTPDQYEKDGQWTWEKLLEVGQKLTQGSGATKTFGYDGITSGLHWLYVVVYGYGGKDWDESMDTTLLGEGGAATGLDFYAGLQAQHHIVPSAAEAEGMAGGFLAGRTAVMYGIKGNIPSITDAVKAGKIDVGITGLPKGPQGRFIRNGPNSFCILSASKNHDAGWKLVNFMSQKDFQALQNSIGASLPVRKSILESGEFKQSLQPWEDLDVYLEASKLDTPMRYPPTLADIQAAFGAEWDLVKLGKESYKDAAAKFTPKINNLLKKAKSPEYTTGG